ncbi:MAG: C45 family peptidase [Cyanobacteria bacterium J06621_11]
MYHPRLRGSHYDMGHHYGTLLYKNGFRASQLPDLLPGYNTDLINSSAKLTRQFYPEICEEIEGFAIGTKSNYERLICFLLSIGITQSAPHCTCFAAITNQGVLFGRNHDYFKRFKKFSESSLIAPAGFHSFVGQGDTFIGREDGVNSKGLAVGYTFVAGTASQPGINFQLVIRGLLEKCSRVQAAIAWIKSLPLSTYQNIVLADSAGEIAVVESGPERLEVRYPEENAQFIVATNNFQHPTMRQLQKNEDRNWYEAQTRYKSVTQALATEKDFLSVEICQDILSGKYGFTCQYPRQGEFDTIWSVVANLSTLKILRAEGNPSRVGYKEDPRLADAVAKYNQPQMSVQRG